jgi:hypothetical protein
VPAPVRLNSCAPLPIGMRGGAGSRHRSRDAEQLRCRREGRQGRRSCGREPHHDALLCRDPSGSRAGRGRRQAPRGDVAAEHGDRGQAPDRPHLRFERGARRGRRAFRTLSPSPLGGVVLEVEAQLTPVEVSAKVLQRVREVAEKALGEPVKQAVISVPATSTTCSARQPSSPPSTRASRCCG